MIPHTMEHIVFPHEVEIMRVNTSDDVDDYGQPVTTYAPALVYGGRCRVSQDFEILEHETGGADLSVHSLVYLPPGDHEISIDDEVHLLDGDWHGRVMSVSQFTQEFYTRLVVRRDD